MRRIGSADQYVISRESNVVCVNFAITPDPPTPQFPGAGHCATTTRAITALTGTELIVQ
jgi:hypothetical protein